MKNIPDLDLSNIKSVTTEKVLPDCAHTHTLCLFRAPPPLLLSPFLLLSSQLLIPNIQELNHLRALVYFKLLFCSYTDPDGDYLMPTPCVPMLAFISQSP